jgi:hypothetical protein
MKLVEKPVVASRFNLLTAAWLLIAKLAKSLHEANADGSSVLRRLQQSEVATCRGDWR